MTFHALPAPGTDTLPCCHRNQWDVPLTERVTAVGQRVTCEGATDGFH